MRRTTMSTRHIWQPPDDSMKPSPRQRKPGRWNPPLTLIPTWGGFFILRESMTRLSNNIKRRLNTILISSALIACWDWFTCKRSNRNRLYVPFNDQLLFRAGARKKRLTSDMLTEWRAGAKEQLIVEW